MGASPVPSSQAGALARRFEDMGWDGLAVPEAHGRARSLRRPRRSRGNDHDAQARHGGRDPLRHPLLAASAMATVQGMSQGRARFGLGRGDSGVQVLHQSPMRVAEFEAYVRQLQAFLRRDDDVDLNGNVSSMARLAEIDPSLGDAGRRSTSPRPGPDARGRREDGRRDQYLRRRRRGEASQLDRADPPNACRAGGRASGDVELGYYVQVAVIDEHDTSGREAIRRRPR